MIKVTYRLLIEGPNDEDITLGLARDAKRNLPDGRFCIKDCIFYGYNWDDERVKLYLDVFLPSSTSEENISAESGQKAWDAITIFSFLYGYRVITDYPFPIKIEKEATPFHLAVKSKNANINKIHRFLGGIEKQLNLETGKKRNSLEKVYFTSMTFYVRHLDALYAELYEEALLNIYKIFELLCRDYYNKAHLARKVKDAFKASFITFLQEAYNEKYDQNRHSQLIKKIEDVTLLESLKDSRKIIIVATELNFKQTELDTLTKLCKLRNSIAHGNTEDVDAIFDLVSAGSILARKMLAKLVLNDTYSNTYPFAKINHYSQT
ncbi:hypothetical protein VSY18_27600 [Bacillus albus]|uniref:hypothetical protein n=1 Tax=Bacillus cereus group TaxID=86661 RepID=UPI0022E92DFF|nr:MULTISPECIES: hypothetical protein [Bacillus cereus group]MDA2261844.1 hypothetical protein [Bacillus cereus group sp. Bc200]